MPYTLGFVSAVTSVFLAGFVALLIFSYFAGYRDPLVFVVIAPVIYFAFWLLVIWRYTRLRRSTAGVAQVSNNRSVHLSGWRDGLRCARGF